MRRAHAVDYLDEQLAVLSQTLNVMEEEAAVFEVPVAVFAAV